MRYHRPSWRSGEFVGCFGLTGLDFPGSDPGGMTDDARRRTCGLIASTAPRCGSPTLPIADVAATVVWAKLDGAIRGFAVERGSARVSPRPRSRASSSLRASVTG